MPNYYYYYDALIWNVLCVIAIFILLLLRVTVQQLPTTELCIPHSLNYNIVIMMIIIIVSLLSHEFCIL